MKMDPLVLKKVDPPVGPVWRAPTVSGVDLLVANKGRVIVPCQDRSRRRRWPKASLYKGLSPGHARPPEGDVGVRPTRGRPTTIHLNGRGWWVRKMSTPRVNSRERQGLASRGRGIRCPDHPGYQDPAGISGGEGVRISRGDRTVDQSGYRLSSAVREISDRAQRSISRLCERQHHIGCSIAL